MLRVGSNFDTCGMLAELPMRLNGMRATIDTVEILT
jgi:hypothetical protein